MKVLVFGATGSVGQQTIDVIKQLRYQLVGISFYHNIKLAKKIKCKYKFSRIYLANSNVKNYKDLIEKSKPDLIVNAIVGFAGLEITIESIKHGIDLCLANKESLVVAGKFINQLSKKYGVNIYPIDSEHTSVYQILHKNKFQKFEKIFITASGGPFYKTDKNKLLNITYQQAIQHPTWKMGTKISIDSATLINKCFEIIEAYWYFHTKNIEALYHPQAYVHAIVKYSSKQEMFVNKPDMHLPIKQALTKFGSEFDKYIEPFARFLYHFEKIDKIKWLPIKWAYQILKKPTSTLPIIINATNEEAISLFKNNRIKFVDIVPLIDKVIKHFKIELVSSLREVYKVDKNTRNFVHNLFKK